MIINFSGHRILYTILLFLLSNAYSAYPSIYDESVLQAITADDKVEQCGDWYSFKNEKCFTILTQNHRKNFDDAKSACKQLDSESSMVFIDSKAELKFLGNIIYNERNIRQNAWIGGVIAMFENDIKHDNDDNSENDCIQIRRGSKGESELHYAKCSEHALVVCQKELNEMMSNLKQMVNNLNTNYKSMERKIRSAENQLQEMRNRHSNSGISLPAGIVAYVASTSPPNGWLNANGSDVSRTTYSNLFKTIGTVFGSGDGVTTFNLPDLRGEFIRGWSDGRDVDKARVFGSIQFGSNIPLSGYIDNDAYHALSSGYKDRWSFAGSTFDNGFEYNIKEGDTRDGTRFPEKKSDSSLVSYAKSSGMFAHITSWNLLKGTRPRNIALLACIKY